ncbi:MAG: RNA polymerase sigma factor [Actinomycetota bacterium]
MPLGRSVDATGRPGLAEPRPVLDAACPGLSDHALIQAFRAGDEAAFDRLFAKHQEYVFNICLGIVANPDDARDCTQETFLRVYRKVAEFRAEAAFSTWLYRVTVNVCVGHLRKRSRVGVASLEDENVREIADDGAELWTGPVREVDERLVREVVAELPEDYRVLLVLRYFQDLSYDEMVQVLGYNMSQLKVKLHRARRAFARRWAARGEAAVVLG